MEHPDRPAEMLTDLYWAGVEAAAPGPALTAALERDAAAAADGRIWIVSLGKAAGAMASAAVEHLAGRGLRPAGGVVIGPHSDKPPVAELTNLAGDHPFPGAASLAAAEELGRLAGRTEAGDQAWVLLSGGATSLAAAPVAGISPEDLHCLYRALLTSGLDISRMNTVRKRFSRWGAGRLAVALHPARVRAYVVSDVIGDDISTIGSGPCVADDSSAAGVRRLIEEAELADRLPEPLSDYLEQVEANPELETPKPGHRALQGVTWEIVAGNRPSVEAVARRASELGLVPVVMPDPLSGEAAGAGRVLGNALRALKAGNCLIAGGETVVRIAPGGSGLGGRCQELALAAARQLSGSGAASLLAAGTDGRDGPNDAAGAIVDGETWQAIRRSGRDPEADLAGHNSYPALDSVGALLRTGPTGTNVMDLVIGLTAPPL